VDSAIQPPNFHCSCPRAVHRWRWLWVRDWSAWLAQNRHFVFFEDLRNLWHCFIFGGLERLFPAFWGSFDKNQYHKQSDTLTRIVLYSISHNCTPILRITNILGPHDQVHNKISVCDNIWDAHPHFSYWGSTWGHPRTIDVQSSPIELEIEPFIWNWINSIQYLFSFCELKVFFSRSRMLNACRPLPPL
jgi:hypothetical protein